MHSTAKFAQRSILTVLILAACCLSSQQAVHAAAGRDDPAPTPSQPAIVDLPNPADIIAEVNNLRSSYGVAQITADPVLTSVAQQEANGIAAGQDGHWRPYGLTLGQWLVKEGFPLGGDFTMDGYRSENWSMVTSAQGAIDQLHEWISSNDEAHMNTMLSQFRSNIGVGVASSKNEFGLDEIYFVIETALRTPNGLQQSEARDFLTSLPGILGGTRSINGTPVALSADGYIVPVTLSTARPNGDVIHPVQSGQSLWSLAIHYDTTIEKIRRLNNLGADNTIYEGQKLLIKKGATQPVPTALATPSATPTLATPTLDAPAVTSQPLETAATSPQTGNSASFLAVLLLVLFVLAAVIASSLKMQT